MGGNVEAEHKEALEKLARLQAQRDEIHAVVSQHQAERNARVEAMGVVRWNTDPAGLQETRRGLETLDVLISAGQQELNALTKQINEVNQKAARLNLEKQGLDRNIAEAERQIAELQQELDKLRARRGGRS